MVPKYETSDTLSETGNDSDLEAGVKCSESTTDDLLCYFAPGPAKIPDEVMQLARKDLFNYQDSNVGVLELSHR